MQIALFILHGKKMLKIFRKSEHCVAFNWSATLMCEMQQIWIAHNYKELAKVGPLYRISLIFRVIQLIHTFGACFKTCQIFSCKLVLCYSSIEQLLFTFGSPSVVVIIYTSIDLYLMQRISYKLTRFIIENDIHTVEI